MIVKMRTGRVMVKSEYGSLLGQCGNGWHYKSVIVRQETDGSIFYYLGSSGLCNTSDGWVTLPSEYIEQVEWESPKQ